MTTSKRTQDYLRAACTGLGFDLGEVWWTSIGGGGGGGSNKEQRMWTSHNEIGDTAFDAPLHFAHLYASDELMKMTQVDLLRPAHERQHDIGGDQSGEGCDESGSYIRNYDRKAAQQQQVHVLSPQLVRCVARGGSEGAVVWANVIPGHGYECMLDAMRRRGATMADTSRKKVNFQTAIGVPVVSDSVSGRICVLVMYARNRKLCLEKASEIAVMRSLLRIPNGTLQVFVPEDQGKKNDEFCETRRIMVRWFVMRDPSSIAAASEINQTTEGVFFDDRKPEPLVEEVKCDGISMPVILVEDGGNNGATIVVADNNNPVVDVYEDGNNEVWNFLNNPNDTFNFTTDFMNESASAPMNHEYCASENPKNSTSVLRNVLPSSPSAAAAGFSDGTYPLSGGSAASTTLPQSMQNGSFARLEEFAQSFLAMSVFDLADIWIPLPGANDMMLSHAATVACDHMNEDFISFHCLNCMVNIHAWDGCVGQAFSSANPVWGTDHATIVDFNRAVLFHQANIKTAFSMPIFARGHKVAGQSPTCILTFYSQTHVDQNQHVISFMNQTLNTLSSDATSGGLSSIVPKSDDSDQKPPAKVARIDKASVGVRSSNGLPSMSSSTFAGNAGVSNGRVDKSISELTLRILGGSNNFIQQVTYQNSQGFSANQNMRNLVHMTPFLRGKDTTSQSLMQDKLICSVISSNQNTRSDQKLNESENDNIIKNNVGTALIRICRIQGCDDACNGRKPYCMKHSGNRLCERDGCMKCAQGSTRFCIAHGGGRRCTHPGCDKGARDRYFCAAHGGGKRCTQPDCRKSAVGGSNLCTSHGGGRRCQFEGCTKSAQASTMFCVKHGGGKKCITPGCQKVARGRTNHCAAHGGGVRCLMDGCNRVAIGKRQLCRAHGQAAKQRAAANAATQVTCQSSSKK